MRSWRRPSLSMAVEVDTREFERLGGDCGRNRSQGPAIATSSPGEKDLSGTSAINRTQSGTTAARGCRRWPTESRKEGHHPDWEVVHETQSVQCSGELSALLSRRRPESHSDELAARRHAAAVMGDITPVSIVVVRCRGGLSHTRLNRWRR